VKTKEELEREINETAAAYFAIAGENMESLKKTAQLKLFSCVFDYCKKYMYSNKNEFGLEEAGVYFFEIHQCVERCIKNYNPAAGKFLHYFLRSVKFVIREARNKEIHEDNKTISFDGASEDDSSVAAQKASNLPDPHDELASFMETEIVFDAIERLFCKKQERVKRYLSALITARCCDALLQFGFRKRYAFVSMPVIRATMKNRGQAPSQKEIAEYFNREEADASRTAHKFFVEVRREIEKMQSLGEL
jgi:hypothetical protein